MIPKGRSQEANEEFTTKKCPECFTYLPLEVEKCSSCGIRVGPVNKFGMASKPFNWGAYLACIVAWLALGIYVWWAFIKD